MDSVISFPRAELEQLSYVQLRELVKYNDLDTDGKSTEDYLEALDAFYNSGSVDVPSGQPMSVRIRRIKEQNNVAV